jgi:DNA ligase-1
MKKIHPKLYKVDTKGRERVWFITQNDNSYFVTAGLIDGGQVISKPHVTKGKNLGRANETSPVEQATFEIEADYRKKLSGEYFESLKAAHGDNKKGAIKSSRFIKPMLAQKFKEKKNKVQFPGYTQRKLNGARAVAQASGLWSRKGKAWVSTPHISDALAQLFKKHPGAILDGELYDLGSVMSLIRKQKPTSEEIKASAKVVTYDVFDLISDGTPGFEKQPFNVRYKRLQQLLKEFKPKMVRIVPVDNVNSIKDVEANMTWYLKDGYEGLIYRNNSPYEFKRSDNLLKYKNFQDAEFKIIDVFEGDGNRSGMVGAFQLQDKKGRIFKSTPKGNREYFTEILRNKKNYIGRKATVRFFDYSPVLADGRGGVPYHGVVVAVREDL